MITRAVVEEVVSTYKYRVRIPIFDRIEQASMHTKFDDLLVATACLPKGVCDSIKVGDIVFVGFENNAHSEPLILGHLYREGLMSTTDGAAFLGRIIDISEKAVFPVDTSIGPVTPDKFAYLLNVRSDIQQQLDELRGMLLSNKE